MSDFIYPTENQGSNLNNYWQQYGLRQPPFEDSVQFAMVYPVPHWQSYLQFLHTFCSGFQPLLIVEGELGIGKTTLISQFLLQLDNTFDTCLFRGASTLNPSQLIKEMMQNLQLPIQLEQHSLQEKLYAAMLALQQLQKSCILIIDDADLLPMETLSTIVQLATLQNQQHIHLYIVLVSELSLPAHLKNMAETRGYQLHIPTLTLEPLNLEDTKNYIRYRLVKAGLMGKMPFSKERLEIIYQLSDGVPGRINRVAQQALIDLLRVNHQSATVDKKAVPNVFLIKKSSVRWVSFLGLVLVGMLLWKFGGQETQLPSKTQITLVKSLFDHSSPTVMGHPSAKTVLEPSDVTANKEKPIVNSLPIKVNNQLTPIIQTANIFSQNSVTTQTSIIPLRLDETVTENKMISHPLIFAQSSTNVPIKMISDTAANTAQENQKVIPHPMIGADKMPLKMPNENLSSHISSAHSLGKIDEKSLLAMQGYTLQILGARTPEDLHHFQVRSGLENKNSFDFRTQFQGRPWYVLVYGNYSTPEAAKEAIKQLPKKVQALHPWVRPLTSVHQAMKTES